MVVVGEVGEKEKRQHRHSYQQSPSGIKFSRTATLRVRSRPVRQVALHCRGSNRFLSCGCLGNVGTQTQIILKLSYLVEITTNISSTYI